MLSPCSPRTRALICVGAAFRCCAIRLRKRIVSSWGPQADHLRFWSSQSIGGEIGQNVDRIRDDKHNRVVLYASRLNRRKNLHEQIDIERLIKSRRLSSGLRRSPAVMQMMSLSGTCSYPPEGNNLICRARTAHGVDRAPVRERVLRSRRAARSHARYRHTARRIRHNCRPTHRHRMMLTFMILDALLVRCWTFYVLCSTFAAYFPMAAITRSVICWIRAS